MYKHCFFKAVWNIQIILISVYVVSKMDISLPYFWSDKDKNFSVTFYFFMNLERGVSCHAPPEEGSVFL